MSRYRMTSFQSGRAAPRGPGRLNRRGVLTLVLACLGAGVSPVCGAAESEATEAAVQAAYLFNFARFTEWPAGAFATKASALNYCQLGKRDALTNAMLALSDRPIQGHPLRVMQPEHLEDFKSCHLVFVADPDAKHRAGILQTLNGQPTLTVSDIEGFAREGGMIGLMRVGARLRFVINRAQTQRAGLRMAADLLNLASSIVETDSGAGR